MKKTKFDIYINEQYVCSTTQAHNGKAVKEKIEKQGFVKFYGLTDKGSFGWVIRRINKGDKIQVEKDPTQH